MRVKQFKRGSMAFAVVVGFVASTVVGETQVQQKATPRAPAVAAVTDTNGSSKAATQLLLEWADKRDSTKGQRTVALSNDKGQLRIPINSLKEIRRLPDGQHEVLYRKGLTQTGTMNAGNVTATTEVSVQGEVFKGTVNLSWSAVQVIELNKSAQDQPLEFTPPKGMKVTVKTQNGGTVELNGLLIYYTYMAPEYTYTPWATMRTTYDVIHDGLLSYLPIMTKTGYDVDISLSLATNLLVSKSKDGYHVDVGVGTQQDISSSQSGTLGWTHLQQERRQPAYYF